MKINRKPELLAPAGTFDALVAAVEAGADAVYFGGTMFNARMNAANFDRQKIIEAVGYCHSHGAKAYITLNTQIYDREMQSALEYAGFLWECGADALITADTGLSELVKKYMPDFPLHASTQMSVHNSDGADLLYEKGFSRVVIAREIPRDDLKTVCEKSRPEIEMFVHGAMCVSCSGQCLMSAMLGGRSGNRGQCAQPCRMSYNGSYPLSLKDMCLAGHIPDFVDFGVASLKIEGRMKSPSYVAGVTEIYRRLLDENRPATEKETEKLKRIFSRGGFTDGYYAGRIDGSMNGVRSESDKRNSASQSAGLKLPAVAIMKDEKARDAAEIPKLRKFAPEKPDKKIITARFRNARQIPDSHDFAHIYLPVDKFESAADGVMLPPVIFDSETGQVRRQLEEAVRNGAKHILLRNVSHYAFATEYGLAAHGDFRLNVFNSFSAGFLPLESLILSAELTLPQIRDVSTGDALKGVVCYGRIPLMLLEKPLGVRELRDTRNAVFPLVREGRRDILLNSVPVYMADQLDRLDAAGVGELHMLFSTETRAEVMKVVYAYRHGTIPKVQIRRIKS